MEDKDNSAPFNMAIATLMRLSKILEDISDTEKRVGLFSSYELEEYGVTNQNRLTDAIAQKIKFNLVWQFYIQSAALIGQEGMTNIKTQIETIKLEHNNQPLNPYNRIINKDTIMAFKGYIYSFKVETDLNNILIQIQEKLKNGGYIMPGRDDPRYALTGGRF